MSKNNVFYYRLMQLMRENSKSVNQVERDLGYPRNALHNYKFGGDPSGKRLIDLAHYFNVSPEYLIGKEYKNQLVAPNKLFRILNEEQKMEMLALCQKWLLLKFEKDITKVK